MPDRMPASTLKDQMKQSQSPRRSPRSGNTRPFVCPSSLSPDMMSARTHPSAGGPMSSSGDIVSAHGDFTARGDMQSGLAHESLDLRSGFTHRSLGERVDRRDTGTSGSHSHETLSQPMLEQMLQIHKNLDEVRQAQRDHELSLRKSQEEHYESLASAILEELHDLRVSVTSEVHASKEVVLGNHDEFRKLFESRHNYLEDIFHKHLAASQELMTRKDEATNVSDPVAQTTDIGAPVAQELPRHDPSKPFDVGVPPLRESRTIPFPYTTHRSSEARPEGEQSEDEQAVKGVQSENEQSVKIQPKTWSEFQAEVEDTDPHTMYGHVMQRKVKKKSCWHKVLHYFGFAGVVHHQIPDNSLARASESSWFFSMQTVLILSNTCLMGYETDQQIRATLQEPKGTPPNWLATCNLVYNFLFAAELLFRIAALRSWFFVSPAEWGWNMFDVSLVIFSVVSDLLTGVNFYFIRTFRILRAIRVMRIIRVLRFFRQLRQMLFAILSCLGSLAWAFIFLGMIMFMFSILFLQGAADSLDDKERELGRTSPEYVTLHTNTQLWFGSLGSAMMSLLASVTGGVDWLTIRDPISRAGQFYSGAFVIYLLFVTVGVMNVLTGVFLSSADEFVDLALIVQNEQLRVDNFCDQMLELFHEMDLSHTGEVDWGTFNEALKRDSVRAYLQSLQLEPTHIRLLFDLLDEDNKGQINVTDFVMGMVRLKGEAKAIDVRILQRELGMVPALLNRALNVKLAMRAPVGTVGYSDV